MKSQSQVEKEFDEKFENANDNPALVGKGDVKQFIAKQRKEDLESVVEKIENKIQIPHTNQTHICGFNDGDCVCLCYNSAVRDILSLLQSLNK